MVAIEFCNMHLLNNLETFCTKWMGEKTNIICKKEYKNISMMMTDKPMSSENLKGAFGRFILLLIIEFKGRRMTLSFLSLRKYK